MHIVKNSHSPDEWCVCVRARGYIIPQNRASVFEEIHWAVFSLLPLICETGNYYSLLRNDIIGELDTLFDGDAKLG